MLTELNSDNLQSFSLLKISISVLISLYMRKVRCAVQSFVYILRNEFHYVEWSLFQVKYSMCIGLCIECSIVLFLNKVLLRNNNLSWSLQFSLPLPDFPASQLKQKHVLHFVLIMKYCKLI